MPELDLSSVAPPSETPQDELDMMRRESAAFRVRQKLAYKLSHTRNPEKRQALKKELEIADAAYQQVRNERDEFFEIRRAQKAQGRVGPIRLMPQLFPKPERLP